MMDFMYFLNGARKNNGGQIKQMTKQRQMSHSFIRMSTDIVS